MWLYILVSKGEEPEKGDVSRGFHGMDTCGMV